MTLENLDKNLNFVRKRIYEESKPFEKSLLPEDFKDLMSDSLLKIINYIPKEFDSEFHYINWSKLFCFRFVANTFREMKAAKLTRSFSGTELVEDSDYIISNEKYLFEANLKDYVADLVEGSAEKIDKLLGRMKKHTRERCVSIYLDYLKILKNCERKSFGTQYGIAEIAKKYGISREHAGKTCKKFNIALRNK